MASPTYTSIPLGQFQHVFKDTSTEVSSVALGGRIVSFSDEFFAEAVNLLKVEVSASFPHIWYVVMDAETVCSRRRRRPVSLGPRARFMMAGRRGDIIIRNMIGTSLSSCISFPLFVHH
jgi:hypothetical protein